MNNKTDKYILNITEHNHLQNTMLTLLQIFIQEQHGIDSISETLVVLIDLVTVQF